MILGVERTTDVNHPETKIIRLATERRSVKWMSEGGGVAWTGAARADLPVSQQNFHRRLRYVFRMPAGFRLTRKARGWNGLRYVGLADTQYSQIVSSYAEELNEGKWEPRRR